MEWVTLGHVLWQLLYWPGGIILGNLLASIVWSSIFEWRLGHHRKKTDEAVDKKLEHHRKAVSDMLDNHHKKIINHINSKLEPPVLEINLQQNPDVKTGDRS